MNRTDRLLAIVLELQARGWLRATDLAVTFETSKRTIYRDMQALCELGVPIVSEPGRGYRLIEGYFLPPLSFTADEAIVLVLGNDVIAQQFDAHYRASAHSATTKITAVLPEDLRTEVQQLQERLRFITVHGSIDHDLDGRLQQVRRAVIEGRTLRFDYHARTFGQAGSTHTQREADPYSLIHYDHTWYLHAYCHLRQDIRHFRLERMEQIELLDRTFTRQPGAEQTSSPDTLPVVARVLFNHEIVRWIREEPSFYAVAEEEHPDGLLITMQMRHERDILPWLLRWGRHVRILEPPTLCALLRDEAAAMLCNHQTP